MKKVQQYPQEAIAILKTSTILLSSFAVTDYQIHPYVFFFLCLLKNLQSN